MKRLFSSTPYLLNKIYRRLTTVKPSNMVLAVAALAIAIFLFGGGLYNLVSRPLPSYYSPSIGFLFVNPYLSDQFLWDSLIATTLFALGVIGSLLMYQSTKYASNPRQAYMMLMVGVMLLLIAYISIEAILRQSKGL
ncbi:MAG: hypothetical protein QW660_06310 [Candidatus Bathyarchaeia archaeon]